MGVKVTLEVENCFECPFGYSKHPLIDREEICIPNQSALEGVPFRCPFVLKQYAVFISEIYDSREWRNYMQANTDNPRDLTCLVFDYGVRHVQNTIRYAKAFLDELAESSFRYFCYHGRFGKFVERDKYLAHITGLLRYVGEHEPSTVDIANKVEIIKSEFLDHSGLPEEDKDIIIDAIRWWCEQDVFSGDFQKTIDDLNATRKSVEKYSKARHKKFKLDFDTSDAIYISLFLANLLDVGPDRITRSTYDLRGHEKEIRPLADAFKKIEKTEFKLTYNPNLGKIEGPSPKNAAELHYTVEQGFDVSALKLWPELVLGPRTVARDILGFKSFKFFVNNKEVSIKRFEKKQ